MLGGEPSQTARRVAAQRLTFHRLLVDFGDPEADERLARDVARAVDVRDTPLRAYLESRTRFFDAIVVESINSGIGQVLIGAAGYDGRAWRYSKPGVTWYEVDHPLTQGDKLRRLESLGVGSAHVRFVGADFAADSIVPAMIAAGFEQSWPTLFLLEGVAVYLERSTLESVLRQFRTLASQGSVLAISLSTSSRSAGAAERRRRFQTAVAGMGEPARSTIEPEQVGALLSVTGWIETTPPASDQDSYARQRAAGLVVAEPA